MEIIERIDRNRPTTIALAIFGLALSGILIQYLRAQPQIGEEEQVITTVDALFTALTTRDLQRLEDCESRLQSYRENGELPEVAAAKLQKIIGRAREGEWEPSARTLYDFILAQRGAP
ncbi:hypothetical protein [Schlesneria sp. T3-172]|uniref:hypothetical protein n=1 Tax=Schlesneria sphaerica TaxID=3373610 RepID=UPI0037C62486